MRAHRVVSLMSTEAAQELGLEPGSLAVAVVKFTQVIIETPGKPPDLRPDGAESGYGHVPHDDNAALSPL